MTLVLVGAIGFLLGLAAHDLAIQGLTETDPLRPLTGVCPQCRHRRGWTHIKCDQCGRHVRREPFVALATALTAAVLAYGYGVDVVLVPYLGFLLLTMALLVTDLEEFRIVDRLNLRGSLVLAILLAIAALVDGALPQLLRGLGGAAAYFVGAAVLWFAAKGRGFGAGDVKLAPVLGLFTAYVSWGTLGWAVFLTAAIGGVVALVLIIAGAAKKDTELPYGPPMIIGAWVSIVLAGIGTFPIPT